MDVMLLVAFVALALGVNGDGHSAPKSECQRRLAECTRTFGQTSMNLESLQSYLACLEPIDCRGNAEDAEAHEKMVSEVAWRLNHYNEYSYDRRSAGSSFRYEKSHLPILLVIGWIGAACKHFLLVFM